jgi:hypothetical protein
MKLSSPKMLTWIIAVFLGLIGLVAYLAAVAPLAPYSFWLVAAGLALLAVGTAVKGL